MNGIEILTQVRQNIVPDSWVVFKRKGRHTNDRPDVPDDELPLLIITPEGVVEYASAHKPIQVLSFADFKEINLSVEEKDFDGETMALVNLKLVQMNGKSQYWIPQTNFEDDEILILQRVIEAFARYPLLFKHNSIN